MFYLNLDKNGYVLSISKTPIKGGVECDIKGLDFSGHRIGAFRHDGKKLQFDEERAAELEATNIPPESSSPEPTTEDILKTLFGVESKKDMMAVAKSFRGIMQIMKGGGSNGP